MITRDNVREVFNSVTEEEIDRVMDSSRSYVTLNVDSYGLVSLFPSRDYERDDEEMTMNGGVFCDKDDLLRLFVESGSKNPFIQKYV